jgi:Co/Zn/Cd efflux system component
MDPCCNPRIVPDRQWHALSVVLVINLAMILIELGAGLRAHSSALLADSADMLGDAIAYGFSLDVVGRGPIWQARGALLKGALMGASGRGSWPRPARSSRAGSCPGAALMSGGGLLALAANAVVLGLLWRHRGDDLNMRSIWLCSRNDVVANVGVLVAALGVRLTDTAWPDIVVGVAIAGLLVTSAAGVIRAALRPAAADRAA